MNTNISKFFIFTAGAALGSAVTWRVLKTKYERIANEEIRTAYEHMKHSQNVPLFAEEEAENEDDSEAPTEREIMMAQYRAETSRYGSIFEEEVKDVEKPYVISPEEFGEMANYESVSLTYYADGVLTDENDEVVDDIDDLVGAESLTTFGQYEDDSVFVRDDRRKIDYEILADLRKYSDVVG